MSVREYDVWFDVQVFHDGGWVTICDHDTRDQAEECMYQFSRGRTCRIVKRMGQGAHGE